MKTTFLSHSWHFAATTWLDDKVGFSKGEWLPASVPGHVHLDLVESGILRDPFERMAELGAQWVDRESWIYRTHFAWQPDTSLPKRVLRFDGLDTVCSIFLNGEFLAFSNNMFVPLDVDVTELLREGQNMLEVRFESAIEIGQRRRDAYFAAEGLVSPVGRMDERAFVRKAQYMYGWDWGPRLVSCGIWKPVRLLEFVGRLLDVQSGARLSGKVGRVDPVCTWDSSENANVIHTLVSPDGSSVEVPPSGLLINDPWLWDPVHGSAQPLYWLETSLVDSDGITLDSATLPVGFRSITLEREPDEHGECFRFVVNGRRLWARGANWIPDHSFPSRICKAQLRNKLEIVRDLGMNMLRVWGGGLYEADDFYDLCDEMGILVWQDFPFACGYYPDTLEYVDEFRVEAEANIRRLRNHPSLAVWCGNNENHQMFIDRWVGIATPPRYYGLNFYQGVIPETLGVFDPDRPYIESSAMGPKADPLNSPNGNNYGDQHYWDVWHGRGDWRFYADSKARFSSEFGFCSSPSLDVWQETLTQTDWEIRSPTVRWHDKTGRGYEAFVEFVKLHYPEPVTLEDWVYYSQLNQRDALRFGIEHYRKGLFCDGTLIWQLNDCWPVQSWAILDSNANYKVAAYELRRVYGDHLIAFDREDDKLHLHVVNDGVEPATSSRVVCHAFSTTTGELLREMDSECGCIAPGVRKRALTLDLNGLNVNETMIIAEWAEAGGWRLLGEPKNTRFAPAAELLVSTAFEGHLKLWLAQPVVDLVLTAEGSTIPFIDNVITSQGNCWVDVRISELPKTLEARSLSGVHRVRFTGSPV